MKNTQNKRTLTLQERHEQHRRNHPRDTISFGEAPIEQPKAKKPKRPRLRKIKPKRNDLGPKKAPVEVVTTKPTQPNKTTPSRRLSGSHVPSQQNLATGRANRWGTWRSQFRLQLPANGGPRRTRVVRGRSVRMSRQTPLHQVHEALGARMIDFAGWDT